MPSRKFICAAALMVLLARGTIAVPAPQELESNTTGVEKRDEYVHGLRIAKDGEQPPPDALTERDLDNDIEKRTGAKPKGLVACAMKAQPNWPHTQLTKEQSDACWKPNPKAKREEETMAPNPVSSGDKKFSLSAICSSDNKILTHFLFGSDFKAEAQKLCTTALDYTTDGLVPTSAGLWGAEDFGVMARRKIAQTIWHTSSFKTNIIIGVLNLAMGSDSAAKKTAIGLCQDAVNYLGDTCLAGISGTGAGTGTQHEAQKPGSVTFSDNQDKPMIAFDFGFWNSDPKNGLAKAFGVW